MIIISSLLLLGLPLALIIFIVIAINKNKQKGGDDVFRQLYVYLVLFATLMMSIGGGIGVFMGVADLVNPNSIYYERYEDYKSNKLMESKEFKQKFDEEKVRSDYDQMIEEDIKITKQEAKSTIINSLGFIVIPFPVFLYFNRLRKRKEES